MDAMTLILALVVATAVIGQFLLIVFGAWLRELDDRQLAEQRARLLEDAADRQAVAALKHSAKLDGKGAGHE